MTHGRLGVAIRGRDGGAGPTPAVKVSMLRPWAGLGRVAGPGAVRLEFRDWDEVGEEEQSFLLEGLDGRRAREATSAPGDTAMSLRRRLPRTPPRASGRCGAVRTRCPAAAAAAQKTALPRRVVETQTLQSTMPMLSAAVIPALRVDFGADSQIKPPSADSKDRVIFK